MMEPKTVRSRLGALAGANNKALAHLLHPHPTDVRKSDGKLPPVKMNRDENSGATTSSVAPAPTPPAGARTGTVAAAPSPANSSHHLHHLHHLTTALPATRPDTRLGSLTLGPEAAQHVGGDNSTRRISPQQGANSGPSLLLQLCDATEVHCLPGRDASTFMSASTFTSQAPVNPPRRPPPPQAAQVQAGPQPASAAAADSSNLGASTKADLGPYQQQRWPHGPIESSTLSTIETATTVALVTAAATRTTVNSNHRPQHADAKVAPPAAVASLNRPTWPRLHSQDSSSSTGTDRVFTPPASDGDMSVGYDNTQGSSQESQLFQLSQIASLQDKMDDTTEMASRKRTADGQVKPGERASTSPIRKGHSRNTSTVSMASTSGSRVGELSADLKTRLSYAMLKVNHGWQANSFDEVESMASQASPTSSSSTIPRRLESSASPGLSQGAAKSMHATPPGSQSQSPYDATWNDGSRRHDAAADAPTTISQPALGPPAPIQPSSTGVQANGRGMRGNYTPTLLSQSQLASPRTPGQSPYPSQGQAGGRGAVVDPILFSPQPSSRDQDAIEALMFMSSPGNPANLLKHNFSPAASPQTSSSLKPPGARHALPTSQPRKSLPSSRPPQKRVGFEKSPATSFGHEGEMDMDSPHAASPYSSKGTPRRRPGVNGAAYGPASAAAASTAQLFSQMSRPTAPNSSHVSSQQLCDADIERMLEKASREDSSDDEGEIQLPAKLPARSNGPVRP